MTEVRIATPVRQRLLDGMAAQIEEHGLRATTVSDVVREAGTSKRTFYRHFPDKEACFLALYHELGLRLSEAVRDAVDDAADAGRDERVRRGVGAFLGLLSDNAMLTRAHLVEVYSLGERGLAARRMMLSDLASALSGLLAPARDGRASRPLEEWELTALMGAVHEVLLVAVETGETDLTRYLSQISALLERLAPE